MPVNTGTQRLTAIIDERSLYASARLLRMRDPLPLPLDSKYHMFRSPKGKQSRVCKICVHCDLQTFPMLLLTVNRNLCDPWALQLMVYECGR